MYCTHCGAWNPDKSKYCAKCGRRLEQAASDRSRRIQDHSGALAVVGIVLVAAVLCIAAYAIRDTLYGVWQGLVSEPTQDALLPTASATLVPMHATATATATATVTPSRSPAATQVPSPTPSPTVAATPTPLERSFRLVYGQCIPHGFSLGSVKGQIFGKNGSVIPGARVKITINGYDWQSAANPATSNAAGWYEWTLEVGQKVQFVELTVDGKSVPFSPRDFEVEATGGCFQRVDFVEE